MLLCQGRNQERACSIVFWVQGDVQCGQRVPWGRGAGLVKENAWKMRAELEESPHCFICLPGSSAAGVPTQRALEMQLSVGLSHWDAPLWNGGRFYGAVGTTPRGRYSSAAHVLTVLPI